MPVVAENVEAFYDVRTSGQSSCFLLVPSGSLFTCRAFCKAACSSEREGTSQGSAYSLKETQASGDSQTFTSSRVIVAGVLFFMS